MRFALAVFVIALFLVAVVVLSDPLGILVLLPALLLALVLAAAVYAIGKALDSSD